MFLLYDKQCYTVKPIYRKWIGTSPDSSEIVIWETDINISLKKYEVTITCYVMALSLKTDCTAAWRGKTATLTSRVTQKLDLFQC